jgi:hypothetical protein
VTDGIQPVNKLSAIGLRHEITLEPFYSVTASIGGNISCEAADPYFWMLLNKACKKSTAYDTRGSGETDKFDVRHKSGARPLVSN